MPEPSPFASLPRSAAWRHREARDGFEVLFLDPQADGLVATGRTCAVQAGVAWTVGYEIDLAPGWRTRRAVVTVQDGAGVRTVRLTVDGGRWRVDGRPAPEVDGCLDLDLEASAFTNALPVHRTRPVVGEEFAAPAAYLTAAGRLERLDQTYRRLPDAGGLRRFDYTAPRFDFHAVLAYDRHGLVVDYPGLAVRVDA